MQTKALLVYIFVYLFLPIISIYKINKRSDSDLYLNVDVTTSLKGLSIIIIIIHHIIQKNTDFILLFPFLNFGCIGVSMFFLLSGYGLTVSYKNKKTYMNRFLIKKFFKLYSPFLVIYILFLAISILNRNNISFKLIIFNLLTMSYPTQIMWYLKIQLLMYIIFYFIYKTKLEDYKKAIFILIFIFIYIFIAKIIKLELYWYNTAIFFPLGILLAEYKEKVLNLLKNYLKILLISSILIFLGIVIFRFMFGNIGKTSIMDILTMIAFNIFILSICFIFNINSFFLKFMGKMSLELYLIHIILLSEMSIWHINSISSYILFFIIVIILSFILNKIQNKINIKNFRLD